MKQSMRRQFELPPDDIDFLNSKTGNWETINDAGLIWVLIHDFPIPTGYNITSATAALQLNGYPMGQIDMVYFYPGLSLSSGRTIGALAPQTIEGKQYQRWSRHRTGQFPWRVGLDNVGSHISLVEEWLLKELNQGS